MRRSIYEIFNDRLVFFFFFRLLCSRSEPGILWVNRSIGTAGTRGEKDDNVRGLPFPSLGFDLFGNR